MPQGQMPAGGQTPGQQQQVQQEPPKEEKPKDQKKDGEEEPMVPRNEGGGSVVITFGRFNPPHIGHLKLIDRVADEAYKDGSDYMIYPSQSQDPKKNPLDPDTKISYMRKMFPEYGERIINDYKMNTIFDVLVTANEEGYGNVNIVVGSDRQSEFDNLAQKYNGELYNFDLINVISAGVRDADAEGVEGMSASKMRKAVMDDDYQSFRRGTPKTLDDADTQALFNLVRQGMGVKKAKVKKENYNLWEISPKSDMKNLRENYIKGKIFRLGDKVQNLNTGLVGEVIRRGTNHLICVSEEGYMFKSWIRDLMEYNEVKVERKTRVPGKPNTLVGTGGYFKYAVDMTPGFNPGDKTNLQFGAKPYRGYKQIKELINKYKAKKASTY